MHNLKKTFRISFDLLKVMSKKLNNLLLECSKLLNWKIFCFICSMNRSPYAYTLYWKQRTYTYNKRDTDTQNNIVILHNSQVQGIFTQMLFELDAVFGFIFCFLGILRNYRTSGKYKDLFLFSALIATNVIWKWNRCKNNLFR